MKIPPQAEAPRFKAVILDVDGVVTPFRSAWQRLHAILGTDGSLNRTLYKMGLINYYEWALYDTLLWHGAPRRLVEAYFQTTRGLEELCKVLKEAGVYIIAISAGLGYTRALSHCFHFYVVNDLIFQGGAVRTVAVSVSDKNKDAVAEKVLDLLGVKWEEAVAVGDGDADLPMLRKAGYSIAFNPVSEEVARAAKAVIRAETLYPLAKYIKALLKTQ
ncbi:HAD family hydrolase [Pyrobaculum aerophilum]|uniref:phosphoserine phosphatase n=1 Tax=Pyrobaculum aerophilum (strain ATCC 51768 / DSM 7523 / JCM 9630 / CIP 104966 / NBRC 100827 / IM2) TaxID=178306 RepID=Q8ZW19_PYRAE|nr:MULTISPECIES: HAD family phosphatase [Pyrobaculum]AAL63885.1 phosphoserine phosphatase (serB) [Pyrobaculum aerophilum str. IM2]